MPLASILYIYLPWVPLPESCLSYCFDHFDWMLSTLVPFMHLLQRLFTSKRCHILIPHFVTAAIRFLFVFLFDFPWPP